MKTQLLERLKSDQPFSQSLNAFIEKKFDELFSDSHVKVVFVDNDPYNSFDEMIADINNGQMLISGLFCDNTIFGNPVINQKFRAVHDYSHWLLNLDFSHESELIINYHQYAEFKRLGMSQFDLDLISIETGGQIVYHKMTGEFPTNQRDFTISELQKMGY